MTEFDKLPQSIFTKRLPNNELEAKETKRLFEGWGFTFGAKGRVFFGNDEALTPEKKECSGRFGK